jgi:hypothetical protein
MSKQNSLINLFKDYNKKSNSNSKSSSTKTTIQNFNQSSKTIESIKEASKIMGVHKPLQQHLNAIESMNIEFDAKNDLPKWRSRTEAQNAETNANTLNTTRSFRELRSKLITKPPTCTFLPASAFDSPKNKTYDNT